MFILFCLFELQRQYHLIPQFSDWVPSKDLLVKASSIWFFKSPFTVSIEIEPSLSISKELEFPRALYHFHLIHQHRHHHHHLQCHDDDQYQAGVSIVRPTPGEMQDTFYLGCTHSKTTKWGWFIIIKAIPISIMMYFGDLQRVDLGRGRDPTCLHSVPSG